MMLLRRGIASVGAINSWMIPVELTATRLFDLFFRDDEGEIVIAQPPNLPISIGAAATLLQLAPLGEPLSRGLNLVGFGAIFTWAWLELFDGVNYFRRSLGLIALVAIVWQQF